MIHPDAQKEKTARAIQTCTVLIDTGDWMKSQLRSPLEMFDLTIREFRLLDLVYRGGALALVHVAAILRMSPRNVRRLQERLAERGWLRKIAVTLPPAEFARLHLPKAERDYRRRGRRISVLGLTRKGKKFMKEVLPRHSKLVKALMRVLDGREQKTLVRICQKLREGDALKFVNELRMEDVE